MVLAIALRDAEDWTRSNEAAEASIKWAKKIKDKFMKNFKISKAYEEMGNTEAIIQEYSKAIKYFNDAIDLIEKSIESLLKEKEKLSAEDYIRYSTLTQSFYIDYLKRKIDVLLVSQDEKKAKESIIKPWQKYLKKKDPNYLEVLTFLADISIHLAEKTKNNELLISSVASLIILDFFAKKSSDDRQYWGNKLHRDIREKCKIIVKTLRIPLDEQVIGKEILNILKQEELETKDHMYIDKILNLKTEAMEHKNDELMRIIDAIQKDEAAFIVLIMAQNELITALADENKYTEAYEKAKEVMKITKKIKNKLVKDFMLGEAQLSLFRTNVKRQDYKQAEKEVKKAIDYFEENINTLTHACYATLELASCYIMQNQLGKAESILEQSIFADVGSADLLARLYELLGGIKLKSDKINDAAINFGASALFYLIANDQEKYREFITLGIHFFNNYLESLGFESIKFE